GSLAAPQAQPGVKALASRLGVPAGGEPALEVARALLRLGWVEIRRYINQLSLPDRGALCLLAESLWVDQEAARRLLEAVNAPGSGRAAALNVRSGSTALYYVDRADAIETLQEITWRDRAVPVTYTASEWDGASLVDIVRRRLATPTRVTDAQIADY